MREDEIEGIMDLVNTALNANILNIDSAIERANKKIELLKKNNDDATAYEDLVFELNLIKDKQNLLNEVWLKTIKKWIQTYSNISE
jgi:hypothetical protein